MIKLLSVSAGQDVTIYFSQPVSTWFTVLSTTSRSYVVAMMHLPESIYVLLTETINYLPKTIEPIA